MPIYEYETKGGRVVEAYRPVAERERLPAGCRRRVVSRLGVVFQPMADPGSAHVAVPRALKELEATMPHERIAKETGFSTRKLKKVWKM